MSSFSKYEWAIIHRHQNGKHSQKCRMWSISYMGYICKYSLDPVGPTAMELVLK